jgi:hypothetical protein
MKKILNYSKMLKKLEAVSEGLPDTRTGENTQYEVRDAVSAGFSTFFTQAPSFLAQQRKMKQAKGKSNAESLFGIGEIPSGNQIRNLLDPCEPRTLFPVFNYVFEGLEKSGELDKYRSYKNCQLLSFDGTEYFSSQAIHCPNCSRKELTNGATQYTHQVIAPVVVNPKSKRVISLPPEFILPQDGHEKQDCELEAMKRWLTQHGEFHAARKSTILGDDLFCHQPLCSLLLELNFNFILVCKPDSHKILYETIEFLEKNGAVRTLKLRNWNGRFTEIHTYRYVNDVPLRGGTDALQVNWCEITITRESNEKLIYRNSFATHFEITDSNVEAIVRDGRTRWKSENENHNVLKTKGYHLEHNFGHGKMFLASFLLTLNLLAFLFHTTLEIVDTQYRCLRQALAVRKTFFNDLRALLRYMVFRDWQHLLDFMMEGLELTLDTS